MSSKAAPPNFVPAYVNHSHHHLSHEGTFAFLLNSTKYGISIFAIQQNIFVYGRSLGGSSFDLLLHLDTTIVSLFFQKTRRRKKEKG